jgi:hypothetical protein
MTDTTFPVLVNNLTDNSRFFIYTLDDLIEFLNESDEFFSYSTKKNFQIGE